MTEKNPREAYGYEDETSKEKGDKSWFEILLQYMKEEKNKKRDQVRREVL